ncbi:aminobenzoate oxygenase, partial [Pseudomonas syringae]
TADRLLEEVCQSGLRARMVRIYWHTAPQQERESIARIMPVWIALYLTIDLQNGFDFTLIEHLQVPDTVKQALRDETRAVSFPVNRHPPLVANIVRFFKNSSMPDDPCVQRALVDYLPTRGTLQ